MYSFCGHDEVVKKLDELNLTLKEANKLKTDANAIQTLALVNALIYGSGAEIKEVYKENMGTSLKHLVERYICHRE